MKTNISLNLAKGLKSKGLLMIAGGLMAVSCGTAASGYSETDGVYFDPNKDTIPQTEVYARGNQVGEEYNYQDSTYVDAAKYGRKGYYENWNKKNATTTSDWGTYAGTQTVYNSWGSPFAGYYAPYYGFGSSFWMGFGIGNSFGWDSPFGYNSYFYDGFYSPFYSGFYGYSPYSYYGMYSPYYYPYYNYYAPYGYGFPPYYGNSYYSAPRRSSGRDGYLNGGNTTGKTASRVSGFRTDGPSNTGRVTQRSDGANNSNGGFRNSSNIPVRRIQSSDQPVRRSAPEVYQQQDTYRSNGGFRSGGFDSGSSRSSGSSSGSSRSGGGFRTGGR